jgi:hypothetical protein
MDQSWVLIDPNSGLHVSWYFWLRVLDEVNRATRYGVPFGLLLLGADVEPGKPARLVDEALSYVPATIRSTDLGGALGPARAGVLLPHQDAPAAATARARILERLARGCPKSIRWQSELLCYPEQGAEISNLLTSGWTERNRPDADAPLGQIA